MSIPELIGELIRRYGSINAASRKTDIPLTTLFRLYKGEHKEPRVDTLRKIAIALEMPLDDVFQKVYGTGDGQSTS